MKKLYSFLVAFWLLWISIHGLMFDDIKVKLYMIDYMIYY